MLGFLGLDSVTYGVDDIGHATKFFRDWGLTLVSESAKETIFETLEKSRVILRHKDDPDLPPAIESGPTIRQVNWGVQSGKALDSLRDKVGALTEEAVDGAFSCQDANGLTVRFQKSICRKTDAVGTPTNTIDTPLRIDRPAPVYERAHPVRLSHVVFFVDDLEAQREFYCEKLGFQVTDEYPGRGIFLRCNRNGPHHDMFLLMTPDKKRGVNHLSFGLRDIYEVMGGGLHFSKCGYETQLGPGRHPVSSAFFWYFFSPGGGLVEYYADEDYCTENWKSRQLEPTPENYAQWAIIGGIDPKTRRQNMRAPKK